MMLQPPTVLPVGDLTGNDVVNVEGERLGTIASYAMLLTWKVAVSPMLSFLLEACWDLATDGLPFPGTQCSSLPMTRSSSSM